MKVDRNDPTTWGTLRWPSGQTLGFLGDDIASTEIAWNNRTNPNIYKVYSSIMNTKELWVSIDR